MEKTLVLIKPDAMKKNIIGKIISMYEEKGLVIEDCKMVVPGRNILEKHYEEHIGKDFFEDLIKFMEGEKIVALVVKGENSISIVRQINGATDPRKADPGTIRYLYGTDIQQNAVHGSANKDDAKREIKIWF